MNLAEPPSPPSAALWAVPALNVLFLLLLWLAVSLATARDERALPVRLPEASTAAEVPRRHGDLVLEMDAGGGLFWGGRPVAEEDFLGRLARLAGTLGPDDPPGVLLRADARAAHGKVAGLADRFRRAGARHVWIAAAPAPGR